MMVPPPLSSPPFLYPCTRPHSLIRPCFHCHSSPPCPLFPLLILTPSTRNQPKSLTQISIPSPCLLPSLIYRSSLPHSHTMSPCPMPMPHAPYPMPHAPCPLTLIPCPHAPCPTPPQSSPLLTFSDEEGEGAVAALSTGAVPLAVPEVDCVRIFYIEICIFFLVVGSGFDVC